MKIGHAIANFFSGLWNTDLEPWLAALLKEVSHDAASAAVPLAEEAIQELLGAGSLASAEAVVRITAQKALSTGLEIAQHDIATAAAGALASLHAAQTAS